MTTDGQGSDSAGIGPRVRAARERLGWTREALAFHAGISWSAIAQVESARRTNLRPSTLAALSRALRVSIDYLVDAALVPATMLEHWVFSYLTDDQFRTTVGAFLADGLEHSEATLAVTTAPKIELLREHLGRDARSVEFLDANVFYSTPIAALEAYRVFLAAALGRGTAWVRVVGEPVWAGRSDSEIRVWTRYESVLNLVFAASPMTLICPYDNGSLPPEIMRCSRLTHPSTTGERGISPCPEFTHPAQLALEPEVAELGRAGPSRGASAPSAP